MPNIETPDGKVVAFPDTMSMPEITAVLDKEYNAKAPTPDQPKSVGGFVGNVGSDIVDIGKGLYQIVRHPLDTASGIGDLAVGGSAALQKKLGLLDENVPIKGESAARRLAAPFVTAARNPSGIPGQVWDYAYEKPISTLMNVSSGLGLTGKIADAGGAARLAEMLRTGEAVTNPIALASKRLTAVGESISNSNLPNRIYGSAIKMPLSKKWTEVLPGREMSKHKAATEAGLQSGTLPTEFGQAKATLLEKQTRKTVDDIIDVGSARGDTVKTADLIDNGLQRAYQKAANSSDPVGAKKIVDDIAEKFRTHGDEIPTSKLQDIKQQIYDEVKYGGTEQTALVSQLQTMGKKGIAHEAMVALEGKYPGIKELNKTDAGYIALKEGIDRAVSRYSNRDLIGLGAKALSVRSIPMAILESTIGHPVVKARLAILLKRLDNIPKVSTTAANVAFQAQQIGGQQ